MLEIRDNNFYLDEEEFHIYSGTVHYFRFLPEYWEDILTKLKLCGLNTVETYMPWNLHEPEPGKFDFSGRLDVVKFLKIAEKLGLYAIVRPGPYICAEWDFGGLPAWLLKDRDLQVRCMYKPYTDAVESYYRAIFEKLVPLQYSNGGNIIAMQIENEYGSYGDEKKYLEFLKDLMIDCGSTELLFTSDGAEHNMLSGGTLPDVFKVANFGSRSESAFNILRKYQPDGPLMCGEFWNGWFDYWGADEKHHTRSAETVVEELKKMLAMNASFNLYTFCGGTNFGFTSGANCGDEFKPQVTSYDDDALLTEWGGYTEKYHAVREVLLSHQGITPETLPPDPELQNIGKVELTESVSLCDSLSEIAKKDHSNSAHKMEHFDQKEGFIMYRHKLSGNYTGKLHFSELADRAHVFINGDLKSIIYRNDKYQDLSVGTLTGDNVIDVLVEDMGHINYGPKMIEDKGVRQICLNNMVFSDYDVFLIPLDNVEKLDFSKGSTAVPVFLKGRFKAQPNKSCFVHTDNFKKGYVFVNGFNLGRYWSVGPQKSLYIPGALLKEENEIVLLELDGFKFRSEKCVEITDVHDIG